MDVDEILVDEIRNPPTAQGYIAIDSSGFYSACVKPSCSTTKACGYADARVVEAILHRNGVSELSFRAWQVQANNRGQKCWSHRHHYEPAAATAQCEAGIMSLAMKNPDRPLLNLDDILRQIRRPVRGIVMTTPTTPTAR